MYNKSMPMTVDKVTVLTAGDTDNKMHGIALKLEGTATEKEEFADLGFGKGAKYVDALLNGELPVKDAMTLNISPRKDVQIKFDDGDMKGIVVPVEIVTIKVWPRQGASWEFEIKTKSYKLKDAVAGRLTNSEKTLVYLTLWTTQGQAFDEKIEFTPLPDYVPPPQETKDEAQGDLGLDKDSSTAPPTTPEPTQKKEEKKTTEKASKKTTTKEKPKRGKK